MTDTSIHFPKKPILTSCIDNDLYKFTMQQTVFHRFNDTEVEYHFRCRSEGVDLVKDISRLEEEIDHLCSLRFQKDELEYLSSLRFFKGDYIDFLEDFSFKRRYITVKPSVEKPGSIDIVIKGPWVQTILFEVPILSLVNQIHFENLDTDPLFEEGYKRLEHKIEQIKNFEFKDSLRFADFGTRRRFSHEWHRNVVKTFKEAVHVQFTGTSNVLFAKEFDLIPIGTMAHEYLQAFQVVGKTHLSNFQVDAFETWAQEYRGDLGIALTDVIGLDSFLKTFDLYFCKLFDGVRHDSGNPFDWGDAIIKHYEEHRIDPKTKTLTFSDGLNIQKMLDLHTYFKDRAKPNFGVGTDLTNDLGPKALQVVIKMVTCNGQPVAKLSDASGKTMSKDDKFVDYLKHVFHKEE